MPSGIPGRRSPPRAWPWEWNATDAPQPSPSSRALQLFLIARKSGKTGEHRPRLLLHVLLHLHEQIFRLLNIAGHHRLDHRRLHIDELGPHLRTNLVRFVKRLALLLQLALNVDE